MVVAKPKEPGWNLNETTPFENWTAIAAKPKSPERKTVDKHSITIAGHRTSVSIERPFWKALGDIAAERKTSLTAMIAEIDRTRNADTNLSSAIRLYVLNAYRARSDGG